MPRSMPTPNLCHYLVNAGVIGVNVTLGRVHVRVASQHVTSDRVHMLCPSRDAGVAQRL